MENEIGLNNVAYSTISSIELMCGVINKQELFKISNNLDKLIEMEISKDVSVLAKKVIWKYNLSHNMLLPDAFIAATALYYDLELFTYNLKDYRFIDGLKLFRRK